jgi:hypothetical protein
MYQTQLELKIKDLQDELSAAQGLRNHIITSIKTHVYYGESEHLSENQIYTAAVYYLLGKEIRSALSVKQAIQWEFKGEKFDYWHFYMSSFDYPIKMLRLENISSLWSKEIIKQLFIKQLDSKTPFDSLIEYEKHLKELSHEEQFKKLVCFYNERFILISCPELYFENIIILLPNK